MEQNLLMLENKDKETQTGHFKYKVLVSKCLTFKFYIKVTFLRELYCQFVAVTSGSSELKCSSLVVNQRDLCIALLSNPVLCYLAC